MNPRILPTFVSLLVWGHACMAKSNFGSRKTVPPAEVGSTAQNPATGSPNPPSAGLTPQTAVLELGCDAESSAGAGFSLRTGEDQTPLLKLSAICPGTRSQTSVREIKDAVDVVFALDVTQSMQPNIDSVKSNIVGFADVLLTRGWDVRFAAVGFRDTVDDETPFGNAAALSKTLGEWFARDGGDNQEAGQAGIAQAVAKFKSEGREDARKVMLLVTDNPFFAGSNHEDFSVTALASEITASGLKGLQLSCSAPESLERFGLFESFPTSPASQCKDLRAKAGMDGANLPFPLTAEVLLQQFAARFEVVTSSNALVCRISSARLVMSTGERRDLSPGELTGGVSLGDARGVRAFEGATLEVGRCCTQSAEGTGLGLTGGQTAQAGGGIPACTEPLRVSQVRLKL